MKKIDWIPIKEQLPDEGKICFIHTSHGQIQQAVKDKGYVGGFKQPNCSGWETFSIYKGAWESVTHWADIAIEPPKL